MIINHIFFQEVDCPFIVPAEYRSSYFPEVSDDLGEMEHPVSRCSQRFILGDRFHNSTKPHKSPLCLFHNIDLCKQSTTFSLYFICRRRSYCQRMYLSRSVQEKEEAIMLPTAKHNLLPCFKSVRSHWLIRSVPGRGTGKCNNKK